MSHTIWEFVYGTNVIINKMYIQRRLHKQKTQNQKKHKTKENTGDLHVNNSTADPTESFIVIKMESDGKTTPKSGHSGREWTTASGRLFRMLMSIFCVYLLLSSLSLSTSKAPMAVLLIC